VSSLFQYKSTQAKWWVDGEAHEGSLFSAAIGNGRFNGGGMMQAPEASLTDGLLDLTVIGHLSKAAVVRNLGRLYKGTFVSHPAVRQFKAKKIRFEGTPPLLFECDGEILGTGNVEFEVLPKAFRTVTS
jgi:diacylglycerol kinase family enzyme